ncbi:MAG: hypothetical protein GX444_04130 [Myxococcales bacterium]|nr:hypothetical protein [Myxococcales bacterium]
MRRIMTLEFGLIGLMILAVVGGILPACGDDDDDRDYDCGQPDECLDAFQACVVLAEYNWDQQSCCEDFSACLPHSGYDFADLWICFFMGGYFWDPGCSEPEWSELSHCGYDADCLSDAWYDIKVDLAFHPIDLEQRRTIILNYIDEFRACESDVNMTPYYPDYPEQSE